MRVVMMTDPAPAVTWEEADQHLRLEGDEEQKSYVEALIAAATAHIDGPDGWLGRSLGTRELEAHFSLLTVGSSLRLPFGPVLSLVSAYYLDRNGDEHQADLANFAFSGDRIVPAQGGWPWEGGSLLPEGGRLRYRAGYQSVPAPIKAAILLIVGDLFHSRATVATGSTMASVPLTVGVEALLQPYRVYR
ncbi:hypothetical protein BV98_001449 [Sphingobium herbicidovorans NBRC 16415]|uniref:Phage gp6-like head-tail connector protein n=1 Tax=Sphingobium herbicidovorans (strain ATCC 700291 / DSM 11019 / CCUG 56400 / KCTC 2939 / LMG 18315 / NBRC 16415 / MH) TaxID=1219045 RepID=A0A086PBG9_SPHHM|nr:hypothetical protein [Sphingobium herbicidovorans]KFG90737.1 hypothetical protein BV98_001449 [Sphingobium herbicidovorans NBRC 16415]